MKKNHVEVALEALRLQEKKIENSFHSLSRSLDNAMFIQGLQGNIPKITKQIANRQDQLKEVKASIKYFETILGGTK
jgi:hypothetical protein